MVHSDGIHSSENPSRSATSASLLARVRSHDPEAWSRLVKLYGPIVYQWARDAGLQPNDAADIVQDVFSAVTAHIGRFSHQGSGKTFRGWLWTITRNRVRDHYRHAQQQARGVGGTQAHEQMEQLADVPPDPKSDSGSLELVGLRCRALDLVRQEFDERTWTAFWRSAVEGDRPADIAADQGVTVWAIYKAKSRVLQRLRSELDGLVD